MVFKTNQVREQSTVQDYVAPQQTYSQIFKVMTNYKEEFLEKGYIVLRGALSIEEVNHYRSELERISGIEASKFSKYRPKRLLFGKKNYKLYTNPNGVCKTKEFWGLLFQKNILSAVREIFGEDAKFLQHNDLHAGFSAAGWHRDSVDRNFGEGSDWDESEEKYSQARVAIYLQSFEESNFRLGILPDSNKKESFFTRLETRNKFLKMLGSNFLGSNLLSAKVEWITPNKGDVIIFDHRLLHCGSHIKGPKYSIFTSYGKENSHFRNHWNYYLQTRKDLSYKEMDQELNNELRKEGLLPEFVDAKE